MHVKVPADSLRAEKIIPLYTILPRFKYQKYFMEKSYSDVISPSCRGHSSRGQIRLL